MRTIEVVCKGHGSDLTINLPTPLHVENASIGLKNFSTYNTIANIEKDVNDSVRIRSPGSGEWKLFVLETGAWNLQTIKETLWSWIEHEWPHLTDVRDQFLITGNTATSKCIIQFKGDYGIDFDCKASICSLLGFKKSDKFEGRGRWTGSAMANISRSTQLIFCCNIVEGSWFNDTQMPILYNCVINVPTGFRLHREVENISYKKVNTSTVQTIHIWALDEERRYIDLRDDLLVVTLSLRDGSAD